LLILSKKIFAHEIVHLPPNISAAYRLAREAYAERGGTPTPIKRALAVPISLHCWQATMSAPETPPTVSPVRHHVDRRVSRPRAQWRRDARRP